MSKESNEHLIVTAPESEDEALDLFRGCLRAKREGKLVRVGVRQSPWIKPDGLGRDSAVILGAADALISLDGIGRGETATVMMTLDRMAGMREISERDLVAVVDGGARIGGLRDEILRMGLEFPYEPPVTGGDATIAELLMAGDPGGMEGRYGGLREYVLSVRLVTPAGEAIHAGSRAVKDVGGYEIIGFLIGSGGRCGLISRVTLRLLPAQRSRTLFAASGSGDDIGLFAETLYRRLGPTCQYIFDDKAADLFAGTLGVDSGAGGSSPSDGRRGKALLAVELRSPSAGDEATLLERAAELAPHGVRISGLDTARGEVIHRSAVLAARSMTQSGCAVHLSFDGAGGRDDRNPPDVGRIISAVPETVVFRSLYPERVHIVMPSRPDENSPLSGGIGAAPTGEHSPFEWMRTVANDAGRRGDAEFLFVENGLVTRVKTAIDNGASDAAVSAEDQGDISGELTERVLGVFDPEGLMIR